MKVKCVLLKGDWYGLKLDGVYDLTDKYTVEDWCLNAELEMEGYEDLVKFEVCDD